jgi:3-hydroxyacyl-[acyl-carrier-protein] dehydratase
MNFSMIDRIVDYEKGKRITARKVLSLCEDYLADHFPSFPIMPGVLMLEAMAQAGAWLMRLSEGFTHPVYLIREVRAVRYGNVVKPGDELLIDVSIVERSEKGVVFKGQGKVGGRNAVVGRFILARQIVGDLSPQLKVVEEGIARFFETQLASLMEGERKLFHHGGHGEDTESTEKRDSHKE